MKETTKLTKTEKLLFTLLIRSKGEILAYTLHRKYGISPFDLTNMISVYKEKGILDLDDIYIRLSKKGWKWVIKHRSQFAWEAKKTWRECPEEFKNNKIEINKPYVPVISKLDKGFNIKHRKHTYKI